MPINPNNVALNSGMVRWLYTDEMNMIPVRSSRRKSGNDESYIHYCPKEYPKQVRAIRRLRLSE